MKTNRKKKQKRLWSITRIRDPRHPGLMLRITELRPGGPLFAVRMVDGRQKMARLNVTRAALGSTDREQEEAARALALNLIAELAAGGGGRRAPSPGTPHALKPGEVLTLGRLADAYELTGSLQAKPAYRREQAAKVRAIAAHLGADKPVVDVRMSDLQSYYLHRTEGNRRRAAARADLQALSIAVRHALREDLLDRNPLDRISMSRIWGKQEPRRPWMTPEDYAKLRATVGRAPPLRPGRERKQVRARKPIPELFGVVLDLLWASGHRVSAVLGLRWQDVTWDASPAAPHGTIRWYAERPTTNKAAEHVTPMSPLARAALERWRTLSPGIGSALLFPCATDRTRPITYHALKGWWRDAEHMAGLRHQPHGGFHALRRGWATARKGLPVKDVAVAGGWRDTATVVACYQHADARTTLEVVMHGNG